MQRSTETPLLNTVTYEILRPQPIPLELREPDPKSIEQAKEWIWGRLARIINSTPGYKLREDSFDTLNGMLATTGLDHVLSVRPDIPNGERIATLLHLLGHLKEGSVFTSPHQIIDNIKVIHEVRDRRGIKGIWLNQEFAVDDVIRTTIYPNPRIYTNNAIAKAFYQSYLPFTPAKPFPPGHPLHQEI